jgi:hypothetical protein
VQNFISLNLKEKSMRYDFRPESKHENLKSPAKNSGRLRCSQLFNSGIKGLVISCAQYQDMNLNTVPVFFS